MSVEAKDVYRKFANEIADKLNEQWKERKGTHENLSKDKKTVLRLALNLHVLYFALGEEISGKIPTTVPMVISAETMTQAVELTKYFAAQRACYEKCCNTLKEDERLQDCPEELKRRILLHPGPYVKPRNLIRRLPRGIRSTENLVAEMQSLQELGFGTLHSRGAVQKVFCKVSPDRLPDANDLVDVEAYTEQFNSEDNMLPKAEAAIFRRLVTEGQEESE
ncbi:uncharacterized protein LOC144661571 [Oculina patagonica]